MIYLDNAATTKVFDSAIIAAETAMRDEYFNPNATYKPGVSVKNTLLKARTNIAAAVGARCDELYFTSCATESNNWVLTNARKNANGNVVISAGEHSSVYEPAMRLKSRGVDIRIAPLNRDGVVDIAALGECIDKNTTLVSVIHVSNETGVINPISEVVDVVKSKAPNALIHCDGVQGLLKTDVALDDIGIDLYSASAHKIGAPKGIGLLYIRRGVNISPLLLGGGQESGLRSGTQNTPYIAAFAEAVNSFLALECKSDVKKIHTELKNYFDAQGYDIVGEGENSGYILCIHIKDVKAEILQNMLCDRGVIIGKGAACSGSKRGNRVLSAMGLDLKKIECCIRISTFVDTDIETAREAAKIISETVKSIRSGHVG